MAYNPLSAALFGVVFVVSYANAEAFTVGMLQDTPIMKGQIPHLRQKVIEKRGLPYYYVTWFSRELVYYLRAE